MMKQDAELEKQTPSAPKGRMSDFRQALLWTAIPIVVLSLISTAAMAINKGAGAEAAAFFGFIMWIAALVASAAAIFTSIGFAIARNRQKVAGVLAGVVIGIVALWGTCFANNALVPLF